jgi:hypothetical protein
MKPNDYIKKYRLDDPETKGFSYAEFVFDMSNDFISLLTYQKLKSGDITYELFFELQKQIIGKWNSILNKTVGDKIPDFLWRQVETFITSTRNDVFPKTAKPIQRLYAMSGDELVDLVLSNVSEQLLKKCNLHYFPHGFGRLSSFDNVDVKKYQELLQYTVHPTLRTAIDLIIAKKSKYDYNRLLREREEHEKRMRQAEEWNRTHGSSNTRSENFWSRIFGDSDFFGSFGDIGKIVNASSAAQSFELLGIDIQGATLEMVKTSYRKLSLQHHPDKGGNSEKFIAITEAKNRCVNYLS